MTRFCQECGKKANPEDKMCVHCGTKLPTIVNNKVGEEKRQRSEKAPLSKKKKIVYSAVGMLAIFSIGFILWAQSYQSASSVEKRFVNAITEKDEQAVTKLVVHQDGSSATKAEAEALIKLAEEEGTSVVGDLVSVQPHDKFLFVFTARKVEAIDQYAVYTEPIEGLSFLFNEKEMTQQQPAEDEMIYGPFIPGSYELEAVFSGKYGETKKSGRITLADTYGNPTNVDMDINVSKVVFYVTNYNDLDLEKSFLKLGEEKIPLQEDGSTKAVGPFILDGSQQIQTSVSMPWGEVVSEAFQITEAEMVVFADVLSEKQYSGLKDTLKDFGEQYVESLAGKDASLLKVVSEDLQSMINDEVDEYWFYSGKFEQLEIDQNSIQVDSSSKAPVIEILSQYSFNEAVHELEETPDFYDVSFILRMNLVYNTDEKQWKIVSMTDDSYTYFDPTDKVSGSGTVFGPDEEAVAKAKSNILNAEIASFMESYTRSSVDAINYRNYYYVEDYIADDSPRAKEAEEYIDYLEEKGITEDLLETELESVEKIDDSTWNVTMVESFTIYNPDSSQDKTFRTKVVLKKINDEYKVYELVETKEV
ncbi:hypothetical protein QGM71_06900 [Virgibacillus sp. C22-A2]|uniref:Zinc ribbon domain-containing protein n=1 Tax=Virgibacillus tibetensis TaxID=3042313 RepID=A0ABU6KFM1_9BACI|nr:hypothetical protein [Virgibacillus sp. C22-A2]